MSRIGKQPIDIPENVTVKVDGGQAHVTGPRGELFVHINRTIEVVEENGQLFCKIARKTKQSTAHWGTTRANLANAITGVIEGFKKQLEIHGVGYRASVQGTDLVLNLGYSHPITVSAPEGITFTVEKEVITVEGNNRVQVGQIASNIRQLRKPEPYKGKGVRYVGEHVRRKVGKVVGAAA